MLSAVANAARVNWNQTGHRLIPSRFPPVSIYEGLVANDRIDGLVEIENLTNPRLKAIERLNQAADAAKVQNRLQNWNHAPFAYSNPEGSLFFGSDRPCLELAADKQTALAVSIARRHRFLSRTSEPAVGLDMRMLSTPVTAVLLDFRPYGAEMTHIERRKLGDSVPEDVDGIIFATPERHSADSVAILRGTALGRSVQAAHYRFVWNGKKIVSLYAFDAEGQVLSPEDLQGPVNILAA